MKRAASWLARGLAASGCLAASMAMAQSAPAAADADADADAWRHYTLACMGCHGPTGARVPGMIPPLAGALGQFVHTPAGREFIIRVPGAANSSLSDAELALVTNMLVRRFSADTMPADFRPFTADEVAAHRRPAFREVRDHRHDVVAGLRAAGVQAAYDY